MVTADEGNEQIIDKQDKRQRGMMHVKDILL